MLVFNPPRTFLRRRRQVARQIRRELDRLHERVEKGLHLGAGEQRIEGLINCDYFNSAADLKVDATDLTQFEDNSIDLIETHHMIEHLSFADSRKAFQEWHRALKPGGLLIMTCPDITSVCWQWVRASFWNRFVDRRQQLDYIAKMIVGSQEHDGMYHKSVYDACRMKQVLAECGFQVEFTHTPYPLRTTPSLLTVARKKGP